MNMTYGTYRKLGAGPITAFRMAHPVLYMLAMVALGFFAAAWWKGRVTP